jgi:hypothetical protein
MVLIQLNLGFDSYAEFDDKADRLFGCIVQ